MIEIKNIRLASGNFATFSIKNGVLDNVTTHIQLKSNLPSDVRLENFTDASAFAEGTTIDAKGALIVPAAIDSHVHSREPGFSHKETWQTLAISAFKGGVGAVIDMPNTLPPTLTKKQVLEKVKFASKTPLNYRFLLGVTNENLSHIRDILEDKKLPISGLKIFFGPSTGGHTFSDLATLDKTLLNLDPLIVFHAEDLNIIDKSKKRLGPLLSSKEGKNNYALHSEIRSSEAASSAVDTILSFAKKTKRRIHIAHVSTPTEIMNIAAAKDEGANVTAEVCPHHLVFSVKDYAAKGPFIVMNPPVRSEEDVLSLRQKFADTLFSTFATDHAPHTEAEKQQDYLSCPSGIPSIEFFYPLLIKSMELSKIPIQYGDQLHSFIHLVTTAPADLFGFTRVGCFKGGYEASFVWLEKKEFSVSRKNLTTKCQWSPYENMLFSHRVRATWIKGKRLYSDAS